MKKEGIRGCSKTRCLRVKRRLLTDRKARAISRCLQLIAPFRRTSEDKGDTAGTSLGLRKASTGEESQSSQRAENVRELHLADIG